MKKTLLILSLTVTVIIIIHMTINAKEIYTFLYAFVKEKILTTVPNYSNERGFDIVSKEDYKKYQQGYCLDKNRILSFEEKYRKALEQYLDKDLEYDKLEHEEWCRIGGSHCNYISGKIVDVDYYKVSDTLTLSNWFEVLSEACKEAKCRSNSYTYRDFFFNELNATKVDPKQYLIIDEDSMMAGFSRPILMYGGYFHGSYHLFLDKNFILFEDSSAFSESHIYMSVQLLVNIIKLCMSAQ
jgi:Fe-S cluster biosynthesis and repair protein YggX